MEANSENKIDNMLLPDRDSLLMEALGDIGIGALIGTLVGSVTGTLIGGIAGFTVYSIKSFLRLFR